MKQELRHRCGEPVDEWVTRLAKGLNLTTEQEKAMRAVAKEAYMQGAGDTMNLFNDFKK